MDPPIVLSSAIREAVRAAELSAECASAANPTLFHFDRYAERPTDEVASWEQDGDLGFLELRFNPVSQVRIGAAANIRGAALLGMGRADLLAQLNGGGAPLPLAPLDAIAVFLHALGNAGNATAVAYFRLVPSVSSSASVSEEEAAAMVSEPLLISHMTAKRFDEEGRVIKVSSVGSRHNFYRTVCSADGHSGGDILMFGMASGQVLIMLRPVSAAEYDAVLRLQPALCPLAAAGDARSGARLLADAAADAAAGSLTTALRREVSQCCSHGNGGGEGGALRRLVGAARGLAARLRGRLGVVQSARRESSGGPRGWRLRAGPLMTGEDGHGACTKVCPVKF